MVRRKAAADVIFLIGMIFGLIFVFVDFTPFWSEGDTYRVILHTHMFGMSNSLDAAGLYLDTALDYSVYQAAYDTLKNFDSEASDDDMREALRKSIEDNYAKYTKSSYSFTQDYNVILPEYKISLDDDSGKMQVTTSSDDSNLTVTKHTQEYGMKEDIEIKRSYLPEGDYEIYFFGFVDVAKDQKSVIYDDFQQSFSDTTDYLKDYTANALTCSDIESCSQKLTEEFQTELSKKPRSFESGNYMITPEILGASVVVRTMDSGKVKSYDLRATQKLIINETELHAKYYPVWNGTHISFENMELVYLTGLTGTTLIEDPA